MSDSQNLFATTGRHVELEIRYEGGESELLSLDLVQDQAADFSRGLLGESTPLAKAIDGHAAGSVLPYRVGDAQEVHILSVSNELKSEPKDLTERRREAERKAVRQSDQTNLIIFASSVNNKWGDYDPGIIKDEEEDENQTGESDK